MVNLQKFPLPKMRQAIFNSAIAIGNTLPPILGFKSMIDVDVFLNFRDSPKYFKEVKVLFYI